MALQLSINCDWPPAHPKDMIGKRILVASRGLRLRGLDENLYRDHIHVGIVESTWMDADGRIMLDYIMNNSKSCAPVTSAWFLPEILVREQ